MKISKNQHVTKNGQVKNNPQKDVILILTAMKDWKDTWSGSQLTKATNVAKKLNAKIETIDGLGGGDSDAIIVFKGISKSKIYELSDEYGMVINKHRASSVKELEAELEAEAIKLEL